MFKVIIISENHFHFIIYCLIEEKKSKTLLRSRSDTKDIGLNSLGPVSGDNKSPGKFERKHEKMVADNRGKVISSSNGRVN